MLLRQIYQEICGYLNIQVQPQGLTGNTIDEGDDFSLSVVVTNTAPPGDFGMFPSIVFRQIRVHVIADAYTAPLTSDGPVAQRFLNIDDQTLTPGDSGSVTVPMRAIGTTGILSGPIFTPSGAYEGLNPVRVGANFDAGQLFRARNMWVGSWSALDVLPD